MKKLSILFIFLLSFNSYALTEDYILYGQTEIYAQKVEAKKEKSKKQKMCEKYSLTESVKDSCLNSTKSNAFIEACLSDAKSGLSQSYCLITKNITKAVIESCYTSTSSERSEIACLILSENKKEQQTVDRVTMCAGLGSMEEINCLKFQR